MLTAIVLPLLLSLQPQAPSTCATVDDCRTQAEAAAAQADYERFHDLAWRAVQKGKPNDPGLMYLLARAMSLSGRPGDAYVMLSRLADMGVATDAVTNDDFRRVRAMKNWPDLEAKLTAVANKAAAPAADETPVPTPSGRRSSRSKATPPPPTASASPSVEKSAAPSTTSPAAPPAGTPSPEPAAASPTAGPLPPAGISFEATPFSPVGLAYDAVSRRFLLGDRAGDRLMVIDAGSHHVANLVHAAAAGFRDDLTAFDIDRRRGDLWVVSASGDGDQAVSTVHKLQLISGRTLMDIQATGLGPVRFVDVAAGPDGTVWLLDAAGLRLFHVRPGSRALELTAKVGAKTITALALSDNDHAYIATDSGILRADLSSRATAPIKAPQSLSHVRTLRWYRGSLIAIVTDASRSRLLRLKLDSSGSSVTATTVVADDLPGETAATVAGDTLYYLAAAKTIRAIPLK